MNLIGKTNAMTMLGEISSDTVKMAQIEKFYSQVQAEVAEQKKVQADAIDGVQGEGGSSEDFIKLQNLNTKLIAEKAELKTKFDKALADNKVGYPFLLMNKSHQKYFFRKCQMNFQKPFKKLPKWKLMQNKCKQKLKQCKSSYQLQQRNLKLWKDNLLQDLVQLLLQYQMVFQGQIQLQRFLVVQIVVLLFQHHPEVQQQQQLKNLLLLVDHLLQCQLMYLQGHLDHHL